MTEKTIQPNSVPLSQAPIRGTVGQCRDARDSDGTEGGTASLKALAERVLRRDTQRDEGRDKRQYNRQQRLPRGTADALYLARKSIVRIAIAGFAAPYLLRVRGGDLRAGYDLVGWSAMPSCLRRGRVAASGRFPPRNGQTK
jgi:hypothetical protein